MPEFRDPWVWGGHRDPGQLTSAQGVHRPCLLSICLRSDKICYVYLGLRPELSDARSKVSLPAADEADLAPRMSPGSRSFEVARALQAMGVKALLSQRALSITRRVTLNVPVSDSGQNQNVEHRFRSFVS